MVDQYLRGDVSRISPEAPVPVLEVRERETRLGGAANAAANIAALGGRATLIGVVGADAEAQLVASGLAELQIGARLVPDPSRPTTKKTRLAAQGQQIVRVDEESRRPAGPEVTVDVGSNDSIVVSWKPVTGTPPGFPNLPISIVGYEVIIEPFDVTLPGTATSLTVSPEFVASLRPGRHSFEVLAIDVSGNQTITEGTFDTQ